MSAETYQELEETIQDNYLIAQQIVALEAQKRLNNMKLSILRTQARVEDLRDYRAYGEQDDVAEYGQERIG